MEIPCGGYTNFLDFLAKFKICPTWGLNFLKHKKSKFPKTIAVSSPCRTLKICRKAIKKKRNDRSHYRQSKPQTKTKLFAIIHKFRSSAHTLLTQTTEVFFDSCHTVVLLLMMFFLCSYNIYEHYLDFQFRQKNGWGQITLSTRTRVPHIYLYKVQTTALVCAFIYTVPLYNMRDVEMQKCNTILKSDILIPIAEGWECKS